MEQGFGFGPRRPHLQALHRVAVSGQIQLLMTELAEAGSETEVAEEVVLAVVLDASSQLHGPVDQGGEVDICGDIGLARFVQGVGTEVMGPIGAERAFNAALLQVLGGVAVVDEKDRPGIEVGQDGLQPLPRCQLDLDQASFGGGEPELLGPLGHLGTGVEGNEDQLIVLSTHPAFGPTPAGTDRQGNRQVVEEFVGDHDSREVVGQIVEGGDDVVGRKNLF